MSNNIDKDKDIGIRIIDKLMEYVENPTEDLLQFIVDTLIYFRVYTDITVDQDTYRFVLSRGSFLYVEDLDIPTYYTLEPLIDRYKTCSQVVLEEYLERVYESYEDNQPREALRT